MKIFKNNFLMKLIVTICLLLALVNFLPTKRVYAGGDDEVWGGVLINPITSLMTAIGDGTMDILHKAINDQDTSIIKISGATNWDVFWGTFFGVVLAILAAVAFVALASATAGLANAALGVLAGEAWAFSMGTIGTGAVIGGITAGICVGVTLGQNWFPNDIYLPAFTISAEEIFSDELPLFDVNFFKEKTYYKQVTQLVEDGNKVVDTQSVNTANIITAIGELFNKKNYLYDNAKNKAEEYGETTISIEEAFKEEAFKEIITIVNQNVPNEEKIQEDSNSEFKIYAPTSKTEVEGFLENQYVTTISTIKFGIIDKNTSTEKMCITVKATNTSQGWSNSLKFETLVSTGENENGTSGPKYETVNIEVPSIAQELRATVSTWYYILRNVALIVLMLLLIYSGIRIVIGSTAGEKAKYKERIMDWLIAVCLVMIMHYIMVFAVTLVEGITDLAKEINNKNSNSVYIPLNNNQWNNAKNMNWEKFGQYGTDLNDPNKWIPDASGIKTNGVFVEVGTSQSESGYAIMWQTDLAGLFRIQAQLENEGTAKWVGYSFCYVVLVLFTLFFAFTYIRRVLYMAFLTIIAPLVAMTYPMDKITDGKAQAFDAWLKEYIFNLMIQPLHLVLYSILVTSAFQLASTNAIYASVAIGFMMPAERLMRRFFGFEKAKTPGLLGGAAGAALAMTGLQNILKPRSGGGKGDSGNGNKAQQDNGRVKMSMAGRSGDQHMQSIAGMDGEPVTPPSGGGSPTPGGNGSNGDDANPPARRMMDEDGNPIVNESDYFGNNDSPDPRDEAEDDSETDSQSGDGGDNSQGGDISDEHPKSEESSGKRNIWGAVGAFTLGVGKQAATGVLKGAHPLKWAGQIAAGATAATAGMLIGVASGDPNKAFQYATTGAVAGSSLAKSLSGHEALDSEELKEDVQKAYYGDEYRKEMMKKQKKEFLTNSSNLKYIREVFNVNAGEATRILETTGAKCFDNGITDIQDIATIHKLTTEPDKKTKKTMSFNYALAARNYATKRLPSDPKSMTGDKIKKYQERWAEEYKTKGYAKNDKHAEKLAKDSFDAAIRFSSAKSDLTKISEEI